jgi:hypothetical protein
MYVEDPSGIPSGESRLPNDVTCEKHNVTEVNKRMIWRVEKRQKKVRIAVVSRYRPLLKMWRSSKFDLADLLLFEKIGCHQEDQRALWLESKS